jgi:hypothetical protein
VSRELRRHPLRVFFELRTGEHVLTTSIFTVDSVLVDGHHAEATRDIHTREHLGLLCTLSFPRENSRKRLSVTVKYSFNDDAFRVCGAGHIDLGIEQPKCATMRVDFIEGTVVYGGFAEIRLRFEEVSSLPTCFHHPEVCSITYLLSVCNCHCCLVSSRQRRTVRHP